MGYYFGLIAVKTSTEKLIDSICEVLSEHKVVKSEDSFQCRDEFWEWMKENDYEVHLKDWNTSNCSRNTCAVWQDGDWAVFYERSFGLPADSDKLAALSVKFGKALGFMVGTAGGTVFFDSYEDGKQLPS